MIDVFKDLKTNQVGTISSLDALGQLKIKRSANKPALPASLSIGLAGPINSDSIRKAIYRQADAIIARIDQPNVAIELLTKNKPRINPSASSLPLITTSKELKTAAFRLTHALDHSYLLIQGPPGTGKTYVSSHIIIDLIKKGKKIGITANSHKAIHNLLAKVMAVAQSAGLKLQAIKKVTAGNKETFFEKHGVFNERQTAKIPLAADLFAGTVWTFSHPHFDNQLDYLFIDEAGQVAMPNVFAMAQAARNIVLVGDHMQLSQPSQGHHPGESGLSVLDFLLGSQATIPQERGIFLNKTRRLRQSVCRFISDAFYEGRLSEHSSTASRALHLQGSNLPAEGIAIVPANHQGCSQKSSLEGDIIKHYYHELLEQRYSDQAAIKRRVTPNDILILAPYNAQVSYLKHILPPDARVGTVDKFQGQEAAIAIISMTSSSWQNLPRSIDFLFSKNRLNVAISRAQCLALIVINPQLLETPCHNIKQLKLVNTFCWLYDYGTILSPLSSSRS